MNKEIIEALGQIEKETGIAKDELIDMMKESVLHAFHKNYGEDSRAEVQIDEDTGGTYVIVSKDIVLEVENPETEVSLDEMKAIDERYEEGGVVQYTVDASKFGRIAAQTAKQIFLQKIKEREKQKIFSEFKGREGEIITGKVSRVTMRAIHVALNTTTAIIPLAEQIQGETYEVGDRIKACIKTVEDRQRGPQIVLSRRSPQFVEELFKREVPEIENGTVNIMGIAREAGNRTKIAVYSDNEELDAVGACIGVRGTRIGAILDDLGYEKVDVVLWNEDPVKFVKEAIKPAFPDRIILLEEDKVIVIVADDELSLAIGRKGQNVRLASKLCKMSIDVKTKDGLKEMIDNGEITGIDFEEEEELTYIDE